MLMMLLLLPERIVHVVRVLRVVVCLMHTSQCSSTTASQQASLYHTREIITEKMSSTHTDDIRHSNSILSALCPILLYPREERNTVMNMSACLFVSWQFENYAVELHQVFVHVAYRRGSFLVWRRCDILCASGFMDNVVCSHNDAMGVTCMPSGYKI